MKTPNIAKFQWPDLVICSNSRQGKTLSYSQMNMVSLLTLSKEFRCMKNRGIKIKAFEEILHDSECKNI